METTDAEVSVTDSGCMPIAKTRERKISDVSLTAGKRSDSDPGILAESSEGKASTKSNNEGSSFPLVVKRSSGNKALNSKTKEEKKKKRKSLVSFPSRPHAFRKKESSSIPKSPEKDDARTTPTVSSPVTPSGGSSPIVHVRIRTPDEELVALPGDSAASPEPSASHQNRVNRSEESPAAQEEHVYDTVPLLSPVAESPPALLEDGSSLSLPTEAETRDAALRAALGLPPLAAERLAGARRAGLTWLPDGLADAGAPAAIEFWPPPEQPPLLDTAGARLREVRLHHQLPACDLARSGAEPALREFAAARDAVALAEGRVVWLDAATQCGGCSEAVPAGQLAVIADLLPAAAWHPVCFTCNTCGQRLADLLYCNYRGVPLCLRHYGDKLKDRCVGCDELIFDGEFQRAGDLAWHSAHLTCAGCTAPLAGGQFGLHDRTPYCLTCYNTASMGTCEGCGAPLRPAERRLRYGTHQWHPACFACGWCAKALEGLPFALREGRTVCSECSTQPAPPPCPRCDVCGLPVAADIELVEYKAGRCHQACFACCVCNMPLGERTFMPKEQKLYCSRCYEETFAARCAMCNGTITGIGVTFQGETMHRECFLCGHCKTSLAGHKFRTYEKKPYCKDCYRDMFAKRCTRCHGLLEGRYSACQNRSWHNECFTCTDCGSSLVGSGFFDIDDDILCQGCASQRQKAKLM